MTDRSDAARRRELQRRAFSPGGGLTPEEAVELRMLSVPASEQEPQVSTPEPDSDAAPIPAAETAAAAETAPASETLPVSETDALSAASDSAASDPVPARRPRWAPVVVTVAALVLGVGAGWLSAPRAAQASPSMTAVQQQIEDEIVASGEFDADTVQFRGTKEGAELWSALRDEQQCVILNFGDQRSTGCHSPEQPEESLAVAVAQLQTHEDDREVVVYGYLIRNLAGGVSPVIERMQMGVSNWQSQYSPEELTLVEALEKSGVRGSDVQILGYDDDIPIWITSYEDRCVAVVDPADRTVRQSCHDDDRSEPSELVFHDSVYQVVWSDQRGPTLTILKQATVSLFCDGETGECQSIDDTTGEIG